ncbi:MAG: hypothetical protein U9Q98_10610 [Bacteroidota bacterium]|nr:hypothetical protein [Bacteroidota bacterium]
MKNISLTLICLFAFGFAGAQNISFTFTAHYHSEYAPLDSVLVENLSQSGNTTLYWPDTVLNLDMNDIPELTPRINRLLLSQNHPNPFQGSTEAELFLPESEKVCLELHDIHGQKLADYPAELERGNHVFTIHTGRTGACILTARAGNTTVHIKMINTASCQVSAASIDYQGNPADTGTKNLQQKQIAANRSGFVYNNGDELGFTGYVDDVYGQQF